jgi:HEPN domain-containing protein
MEFADRDMASARFLTHMQPMPLEIIGFHCQQALEKYLKAFLVSNGIEPEKSHDLIQLQKSCIGFDAGFSSLSRICSALSSFAAKARYPGHENHVDLSKMIQLLASTEEACLFIQRILQRPSEENFHDRKPL